MKHHPQVFRFQRIGAKNYKISNNWWLSLFSKISNLNSWNINLSPMLRKKENQHSDNLKWTTNRELPSAADHLLNREKRCPSYYQCLSLGVTIHKFRDLQKGQKFSSDKIFHTRKQAKHSSLKFDRKFFFPLK